MPSNVFFVLFLVHFPFFFVFCFHFGLSLSLLRFTFNVYRKRVQSNIDAYIYSFIHTRTFIFTSGETKPIFFRWELTELNKDDKSGNGQNRLIRFGHNNATAKIACRWHLIYIYIIDWQYSFFHTYIYIYLFIVYRVLYVLQFVFNFTVH